MILSKQRSGNRARADRWLFLLLAGLLLAGFSYVLLFSPRPQATLREGIIFCDAEKVQGKKFINTPYEFSQGQLQSNEEARSGSHSCKVPTGEGLQYGFGFQLFDVTPGKVWKTSVWRLKTPYGEGRLVVEGRGGGKCYFKTGYAVDTDDNGWEKLEITFFVPYQDPPTEIQIYVYGSGLNIEYFDDLQIEEIDIWPKEIFQPEVLDLKIDNNDFTKLETKRRNAIKAGILEVDDTDWVNGRILSTGNDPIPIKLRLKGDWLDHLLNDKWSFRIKVRDPYNWKQLKTFSLHTPSARYYLHEWLLHQLWEKEDILTTRYDLIELKLNGQSLGIYAYEEHFEKQLIESRQRREGPIIKFSEDGFWSGIKRQLASHGYMKPGAPVSAMDPFNADIQAFKEQDINLSASLSQQYEEARNLIHQLREGTRAPSEIFDLDKLAKYYAICDALNAYHGIIWHNQRFYYNPITSNLEPIGFDGFGENPGAQYSFLGQGALNPGSFESENLFSYLFLDGEFTALYLNYLYQFTSRSYMKDFLDTVTKDWTPRLQFIQMEFPEYQPTLNDFLQQALYVHSLILPYNDQSIKTFIESRSGSQKRLLLNNSHTLPLEVLGYSNNNKKMTFTLEESLILPASIPRVFLKRILKDSMIRDFAPLRFFESRALHNQGTPLYLPLNVSKEARYLFFKLPGIDSLFHCLISDWEKPKEIVGVQQIFTNQQPVSNDLYAVEGKNITFRQGKHKVKKDLVFPEGYQIIINPGTEIDLTEKAGFLSRSPVRMLGEAENLIRIFSSDGSGNGFSVLGASSKSVFKHVIFEELGTLSKAGWELTGALNFYQTEVEFYRCVFRHNHCEDALNVIRSEFKIDHCNFSDTSFDGFDSDFSKGEITNSYFYQIGNDGLDFSGSVVNVRNCQLDQFGDKGVSVGEESDVTVFSTHIQHAPIALASKDLSVLYVRDVRLTDCRQGFVAYQKKPEYGGGKIIVESYEAHNVRRLHSISENSTLQMEGRLIE